jgi:hypothetical protein
MSRSHENVSPAAAISRMKRQIAGQSSAVASRTSIGDMVAHRLCVQSRPRDAGGRRGRVEPAEP